MKSKLRTVLVADASDMPALFLATKPLLIDRERGRCWFSGLTAKQLGKPLQVDYHPIGREYAEKWDWPKFARACMEGKWGHHARVFDWVDFFVGSVDGKPVDPYKFVDDMRVNGQLIAPDVSADLAGKSAVPYHEFIARVYSKDGK